MTSSTADYAPNSVDDPPCKCGNDVGDINPDLKLPLVPSTAGRAIPHKYAVMAVRAPATEVMRPLGISGTPASRITIQKSEYHVMVTPFGGSMQFALEPQLLDPTQEGLPGSFITDNSYPNVEDDPRAIVLRHLWGKRGHDVQPFALRRSGYVVVRGQISLVRVGTRYFDGDNVYRHLGACTILEQGRYLRFLLTALELPLEFISVVGTSASAVY